MRIQRTRIEQLDVKFPGLRTDVDLMLDKQATLDSIAAMLKERTGETLGLSTISAYKQKRWLIARLRLRDLAETFQAVKKELGANAISESTQARLLELINDAMTRGAALDPHFLLKEQRLWAVHAANLEKIETEKQKLLNENQRLKQAAEEKTEKTRKAIADGEKDPKRGIEQLREIYGLPPLPA